MPEPVRRLGLDVRRAGPGIGGLVLAGEGTATGRAVGGNLIRPWLMFLLSELNCRVGSNEEYAGMARVVCSKLFVVLWEFGSGVLDGLYSTRRDGHVFL